VNRQRPCRGFSSFDVDEPPDGRQLETILQEGASRSLVRSVPSANAASPSR
jgi:hypothetical protein